MRRRLKSKEAGKKKTAAIVAIITIISIVTSAPFSQNFSGDRGTTTHNPQAKTRGAAEVSLML
jgi:hypothetical protein